MPQDTNHAHFVVPGIDVDDDLDMMLVKDPILPPLPADKDKDNSAITNQDFNHHRNSGDSPPDSESAIPSTPVSQKTSSTNPNLDEPTQPSEPSASAFRAAVVVVTPPNAKNGTTKIRSSSESDENYEDDDISEDDDDEDKDDISEDDDDDDDDDDNSDSEDGSCFDGTIQKQNFATVTNSRPSRRAKSAAVEKLAAACDDASDGSEEEEDVDTDEPEGEDYNYEEGEIDEEHNHDIDPREAPEAVQESPEEDEDSYDSIGEEKDSKKPAATPKKDSVDGDANDSDDDDDEKADDGSAAPNGSKKRKKAPENAGSISECGGDEDADHEEANDFIYSTKSKKQKKTIQTNTSAKEERDDDSTSRETTTKIKTLSAKKEEEGGDGNSTPKKKSKKPRVSESVVNDAAEKMLVVLIENYKDDIKQVPMDILAASITSKKGKPYTNHRSDAICEGLKLLLAQNKAEKIKHGKIGAARLLPSEIDKIPKEEISKDPIKVLEQRFQQFLERLAKHKKGGAGEMVVKAAKAVWKKLQDGEAYSRKELVATTSYKGTNSSGFEGIMKVLGELNFIEGKGKSSFTDKVFPHGRP